MVSSDEKVPHRDGTHFEQARGIEGSRRGQKERIPAQDAKGEDPAKGSKEANAGMT